MKKLIIICLCVFMLIPLVAQESKLKMTKGTENLNYSSWQLDSFYLLICVHFQSLFIKLLFWIMTVFLLFFVKSIDIDKLSWYNPGWVV